MEVNKHGLSVGIDRIDNNLFFRMKLVGMLTHEDYETIIPMLESAIAGISEPRIQVLVDLTELQGWELRAAWDDFKLGITYGSKFSRIAVIGNRPWEKIASRVGSWFTSGEVEYFETEAAAMHWLNRSE